MGKSKFYAFFKTEEEFAKAVLRYIEKRPELLRGHDEELRHFTRVWMTDNLSMALGRMGFREKRFRQLDEKLTEVIKEYFAEMSDDLKYDKEMVYSRELFERELKQYCGKFYTSAEERYA